MVHNCGQLLCYKCGCSAYQRSRPSSIRYTWSGLKEERGGRGREREGGRGREGGREGGKEGREGKRGGGRERGEEFDTSSQSQLYPFHISHRFHICSQVYNRHYKVMQLHRQTTKTTHNICKSSQYPYS